MINYELMNYELFAMRRLLHCFASLIVLLLNCSAFGFAQNNVLQM